jgi:hypothetical protein
VFFLNFIVRNLFRAKLRASLTVVGLVIAILAFGLLQTVVRPGMPARRRPRRRGSSRAMRFR